MTKYNDNGNRAAASTKKFLNDSGLSHVFSLITSFVRNYASPKSHNHDGAYAKSSHTHTTSQVTGLDSALAGKAPSSHTHTIAQVTSLQSSLDSKTPSSRKVNGKPLSTDITLTSVDVKADAAGSATNALNSAKQYTDTIAAGKAAKSHIHDATNITTGTLSQDRLPLVPVTKGGTGKTNGKDAANYFINSLEEGTATPTDADKIITQYVGGGTTTTTYHRRPLSTLWSYIKPKCDAIYQAKGSYAALSHTHAISNITDLQAQLDSKQAKGSYAAASHTHTIANVTNLQSTLDSKQPKGDYAAASHSHNSIKDAGDGRNITFNYSADGASDANWYAVWNGAELKSMSKAMMQKSLCIEFKWLGLNPTNGTANDTRAFWSSKGTGYAFFSATNQLNNQPSQYGFLINIVYASEVHQEFWVQSNGRHYRRGGNGETNAMPSWTSVEASLLSAYPVGAVYISWSSTSPASLFGGSWTAITGRFPYFNAGTSVGGSNSHTLSVNELASHNHQFWGTNHAAWLAYNGAAGQSRENVAFGYVPAGQGCFKCDTSNFRAVDITSVGAGGNWSHNNMPSYQTLYAWRRTG